MATTTLKVPTELRDRIASEARSRHVTIAAFLDDVIDDWDRQNRLAALKSALAENPPDEEYWREFEELDDIGGGLRDVG